jgi:hypothetical protein
VLAAGAEGTFTSEKKDDKEVVTEVKRDGSLGQRHPGDDLAFRGP